MDLGLSGYRTALDALFARTGATSIFGLERVEALLQLLGDPHLSVPVLHVAGTNGKGSVVETLYTLLRAKGMRVGKYTSPHLIDFRERVIVDDRQIGEADVTEFLSRWETDTARLGATFFETTTALAFDYFARLDPDVVLIETGLGGRLDATNVVRPLVAGVTSIAVDHAEYLGEDPAQIAAEKAGIFKAGAPAVIGSAPPAAYDALLATAATRGATPVVQALREYQVADVRVSLEGTRFTVNNRGQEFELLTGLIGEPQATNAVVALAMLDAAGGRYAVHPGEAAEVLPRVRLRGRFERIGKFVLDVAHNPDGVRALANSLKAIRPPGPVAALVGVLADKNWREMIDVLAGAVDRIVLTSPVSAPANRAWDPGAAMEYARDRGWQCELERDFYRAIELASRIGETVVVTGSFHTVGDVLASGHPLIRLPLSPSGA